LKQNQLGQFVDFPQNCCPEDQIDRSHYFGISHVCVGLCMLEVFGAVAGICYVAPTFYLYLIRQRFLHCPYWNDSIPCRRNSHSFTSALGSPCQHWTGEVRVWWVQETLLLHS